MSRNAVEPHIILAWIFPRILVDASVLQWGQIKTGKLYLLLIPSPRLYINNKDICYCLLLPQRQFKMFVNVGPFISCILLYFLIFLAVLELMAGAGKTMAGTLWWRQLPGSVWKWRSRWNFFMPWYDHVGDRAMTWIKTIGLKCCLSTRSSVL